MLLCIGNLFLALRYGVNTGEQNRPQSHNDWNGAQGALGQLGRRRDAKILAHADVTKRNGGQVEPAGAAHFVLAVDVIHITLWKPADSLPGGPNKVVSLAVCQRFGRTALHAPRQQSLGDARIAQGALLNPWRQGLFVFIGWDFERAGNHAVATTDAHRGVVGDGTGFSLLKCLDKTGRCTRRLQAVIALCFQKMRPGGGRI